MRSLLKFSIRLMLRHPNVYHKSLARVDVL